MRKNWTATVLRFIHVGVHSCHAHNLVWAMLKLWFVCSLCSVDLVFDMTSRRIGVFKKTAVGCCRSKLQRHWVGSPDTGSIVQNEISFENEWQPLIFVAGEIIEEQLGGKHWKSIEIYDKFCNSMERHEYPMGLRWISQILAESCRTKSLSKVNGILCVFVFLRKSLDTCWRAQKT